MRGPAVLSASTLSVVLLLSSAVSAQICCPPLLLHTPTRPPRQPTIPAASHGTSEVFRFSRLEYVEQTHAPHPPAPAPPTCQSLVLSGRSYQPWYSMRPRGKMLSKLALHACASHGVPSWNVTPLRAAAARARNKVGSYLMKQAHISQKGVSLFGAWTLVG